MGIPWCSLTLAPDYSLARLLFNIVLEKAVLRTPAALIPWFQRQNLQQVVPTAGIVGWYRHIGELTNDRCKGFTPDPDEGIVTRIASQLRSTNHVMSIGGTRSSVHDGERTTMIRTLGAKSCRSCDENTVGKTGRRKAEAVEAYLHVDWTEKVKEAAMTCTKSNQSRRSRNSMGGSYWELYIRV